MAENKTFLTSNGRIDLKGVHLGDVSTDSYALWKAVKELQTGEKQISLCELADNGIISDNAFRLIVQAVPSPTSVQRYSITRRCAMYKALVRHSGFGGAS